MYDDEEPVASKAAAAAAASAASAKGMEDNHAEPPIPILEPSTGVYWCLNGHRNVKKNPDRFRCTTCKEKTLVKEHPKQRAVDFMCT